MIPFPLFSYIYLVPLLTPLTIVFAMRKLLLFFILIPAFCFSQSWNQIGQTVFVDNSGQTFGYDVEINSFGNRIVISDPGKYSESYKDHFQVEDDPKRVAILYFDNTSGESKMEKLKKGLADMLITDLSNVSTLSIVERDKLEEIIKEQKLSHSKDFDAKTAAKLGKLLGAQIILTGSFFEMFGTFRIDARFIDVETGEILKSDGVEGPTANFFKLEKQLAFKIIENLDVNLKPDERALINNSEKNQEISYQAALIYSQALELLDEGKRQQALEKLNVVLLNNPAFESGPINLNNLSLN